MKPKYRGGSLVNLMSSIAKRFDVEHPYPQMRTPIPQKKNVVVLVIDGLGAQYLDEFGQGGFLHKHKIAELTSVLPSATTIAMSTIFYGLPAQQTGLVGWHMYLRELGGVITPLPFRWMVGGDLEVSGIEREDLFPSVSFSEQLPITSFNIYPRYINGPDRKQNKSHFWGYQSLTHFGRRITETQRQTKKASYTLAYWPEYDAICHHMGVRSFDTFMHFQELDKWVERLSKRLKNTVLLVTADHGMIDTPDEKTIDLLDHPKLKDCLAVPLYGEPRWAYCIVRNGKEKEFETYVKKKLGHAITLHKSSDLVSQSYFGMYEKHPELLNRVGDYVLECKDEYVISEGLLHQPANFLWSNHGGTSEQEMLVPLCIIECD